MTESVATTQGRVWLIDGERFFSPNYKRFPGKPPVYPSPSLEFTPGISKVADFQDPQWWDPKTEWMAFVPKQPVGYCGVWFETMLAIPRWLSGNSSKFHLPASTANVWVEAERTLTNAALHLGAKNNLAFLKPLTPSTWGYKETYLSQEQALQHIKEGRDWFAMWLGLLYWITRRVPEDRDYVEGLKPPAWVVQLVRFAQRQSVIDVIRLNPLLQSKFDVERVGIFLHHPKDIAGQPLPRWLIHQGVPIWYRWGDREEAEADELSRFFIRPSSEQLKKPSVRSSPEQHVPATFPNVQESFQPMHTASEMSDPGSDPWADFELPTPHEETIQWTPTSPEPECLNETEDESAAMEKRADEDAERRRKAREIWESFKKERSEKNEAKKRTESKVDSQRRQQRERQPPTASAPVYEWDWDFDNPGDFTRQLVRKDAREEVLENHRKYGERIYDSFRNEWNCCSAFEPLCYPNVASTPSPPSSATAGPTIAAHTGSQVPIDPVSEAVSVNRQPRAIETPASTTVTTQTVEVAEEEQSAVMRPFIYTTRGPEFDSERAQYHVLEILASHFGFVTPVPLPSSSGLFVGINEHKTLAAVLGLPKLHHKNLFFQTPIGKMCTRFTCCFAKGEEGKPEKEFWDLAADNWKPLQFSTRLSSLRQVKNNNCTMFMFDFGSSASVPWKLAVYTASAALYVCRQDEILGEEEIAKELVTSGIPFRTLQAKDTLLRAPKDRKSNSEVAMRMGNHKFNRDDWDFYIKQCESVMTQRRARAALLRGGFAWRVALRYMSSSEAVRGPWGLRDDTAHVFTVKDSQGVEYIDDELTPDEYNILCGMYRSFTGFGDQVAHLSWFPSIGIFEGSGVDVGWWTQHCEEMYVKRLQSIQNEKGGLDNFREPLSASDWRRRVRGFADGRNAWKQLQKWSNEFVEAHLGSGW